MEMAEKKRFLGYRKYHVLQGALNVGSYLVKLVPAAAKNFPLYFEKILFTNTALASSKGGNPSEMTSSVDFWV